MYSQTHGFTIIELLITLAIVGILASIAYPSYQKHIAKVRRNQAIIAIHDTAAQLEQHYNTEHSYKNFTIKNNDKDFYRFELETKINDYKFSAVPVGTQAQRDKKCGTLTLDQLGVKTISGSGNLISCWP